jgi:hypothetical protein
MDSTRPVNQRAEGSDRVLIIMFSCHPPTASSAQIHLRPVGYSYYDGSHATNTHASLSARLADDDG